MYFPLHISNHPNHLLLTHIGPTCYNEVLKDTNSAYLTMLPWGPSFMRLPKLFPPHTCWGWHQHVIVRFKETSIWASRLTGKLTWAPIPLVILFVLNPNKLLLYLKHLIEVKFHLVERLFEWLSSVTNVRYISLKPHGGRHRHNLEHYLSFGDLNPFLIG